MNRDVLKSIIGIYLIIAHAAAIFGVVLLHRYLDLKDQFELISIMTPVFAVHTSAVVKDFIKNQSRSRSTKRVNFNFVFISFFFHVVLTAALFGTLLTFRLGIIDTVDNLRHAVLTCEVCFGVYLGLLTENLFKRSRLNQTLRRDVMVFGGH
jgi:hypothetical protein